MSDTETSLDAWCSVVQVTGEEMESATGRRRYGATDLDKHVELVSDLSGAIDLLFSTTLAVEVGEDSGCLDWCTAINRDAGLNRFVLYPDGDLMVETQLMLPKQPGASASALYLVNMATWQQRNIAEVFSEGGPTAVADALVGKVEAADLRTGTLEHPSEWPDALELAARRRTPNAQDIRCHPRGVSLEWHGGGSSRPLSATVDASMVEHPTWGPSLDRVLAVCGLDDANLVDLCGAINRSRLAGAAGCGAWGVSLAGNLSHRTTVPLVVLELARELSGGDRDGQWILDWLFDAVGSEMAVLQHVLAR